MTVAKCHDTDSDVVMKLGIELTK